LWSSTLEHSGRFLFCQKWTLCKKGSLVLVREGGNWLWRSAGTAFAKPPALLVELRKVSIDGKVCSMTQPVEQQGLWFYDSRSSMEASSSVRYNSISLSYNCMWF